MKAFWLSILFLRTLLFAFAGMAETADERLSRAFDENKPAEALVALDAGANPNGIESDGVTASRGFTYLMRCVEGLKGPKATEWRAVFDSFVTHGANLNLPDKHGFNAMMIAERSGSPELVQLLMERGAKPLYKNSIAVKARLAALDARLLEALVDQYAISHMMHGEVGQHRRKELYWKTLWESMQRENWGIAPTYKIVVNRGRDEFGNEFRLFSSSGSTMPIVLVSDKTIEVCAGVVDKDFWKEFYVPQNKWDDFISGKQ